MGGTCGGRGAATRTRMSGSIDAKPDGRVGFMGRPQTATETQGVRGLDPHLVSLVAPASFEAEQYRVLRSRLESRHEGRALQVLAVTSAVVGDGKTTTAINLAGSLAQARDARGLLVDADRPRASAGLQRRVPGPRRPGLGR